MSLLAIRDPYADEFSPVWFADDTADDAGYLAINPSRDRWVTMALASSTKIE